MNKSCFHFDTSISKMVADGKWKIWIIHKLTQKGRAPKARGQIVHINGSYENEKYCPNGLPHLR